MNNTVSALQLKWTGLRLNKIGKASKTLKKLGFWKCGVGDVNNRNGFTHIRPGNIDKLLIVKELKKFNVDGLLVQFTDLQWGRNVGLTDKQWQDRVDLTLP